jgi:hypothetical protein
MKINFKYLDVDYSANINIKSGIPKEYHVTSVSPGILELRYPLIFTRSLGGLMPVPDIPGYPGLGEIILQGIISADPVSP